MKLLTAAIAGDLLKLDINMPMAAKAEVSKASPVRPVTNKPRSSLVPTIKERGIKAIRITRHIKKIMMPRYFPNTSSVIDTGEDNNNFIVPLRNSSLNRRMVIKGAINSRTKPATCNKPMATISVSPLLACHDADSTNFDKSK